ncbi:helix-turn-helix domain-containing protein [Xylocopilactobacillus apis]|uniref:Insertion element IS150 protein InsJ-like helix-turn-helix domain-containing protein n=1 Tax=Xylocopilactobacillus apis TaxID=2932183 RepID=A0AAU9DGX1_9LACO|nr:helix-turn-helix domain-containing protein [Xylocopilactobacillus apis]BDR57526.1 hypothetical protein KIMC2_20880 [Xylocopilactobacillus apis]
MLGVKKTVGFDFNRKLEVVKWTLNHQMDYRQAVEKFDLSYQQVYTWVAKYRKDGDRGLIDRRGRKIPFDEMNEVQRLNCEVKLLRVQLQDRNLMELMRKKSEIVEGRG